ncbi:MAG: hypothetical protein CMC08_02440 [Flavobacteriaceae bacterium]|nr:hypothetical protein [Flavobacteriaceae bacterium]
MRSCLCFLFCLSLFPVIAQPNTEIYLLDSTPTEDGFSTSNFRNISNNPGYDNQPYFTDNNQLLFAKTRNGQTDIALYNLRTGSTNWQNSTPQGGEYSPRPIPGSGGVAAVRLDTTGLQRLYAFDTASNTDSVLVADLQVAYFTFVGESLLLASVLGDDGLHLVTSNLGTRKTDTLLTNAGRSIHAMPNGATASYTYINEQGNHDIYQFDFKTGESYFVAQLPIGVQDHIWLNETTLLIGSGAKLFSYDLFGNGKWIEVADLSDNGITDISRLAISPNGRHLALVANPQS